MRLRRTLQRFRQEHSGAALVEFTLVAPVLISLMCGLAEFGQVLRQYHIMQKGVRDAARYLSRAPAEPPCTGVVDTNWSTYASEAQNLAVFGETAGGSPLSKGWTDPATVSIPDPPCLANPRPFGAPLPKITVTASAPYTDIGLLSFLGLGPITLTVSHEELKVS